MWMQTRWIVEGENAVMLITNWCHTMWWFIVGSWIGCWTWCRTEVRSRMRGGSRSRWMSVGTINKMLRLRCFKFLAMTTNSPGRMANIETSKYAVGITITMWKLTIVIQITKDTSRLITRMSITNFMNRTWWMGWVRCRIRCTNETICWNRWDTSASKLLGMLAVQGAWVHPKIQHQY